MGTYFTRTRAWVYIAFYDEYVGRHINTSAGLSILFMIPCYWYDNQLNFHFLTDNQIIGMDRE